MENRQERMESKLPELSREISMRLLKRFQSDIANGFGGFQVCKAGTFRLNGCHALGAPGMRVARTGRSGTAV